MGRDRVEWSATVIRHGQITYFVVGASTDRYGDIDSFTAKPISIYEQIGDRVFVLEVGYRSGDMYQRYVHVHSERKLQHGNARKILFPKKTKGVITLGTFR